MRKLLFQMMTSVDGYYEGPNHELDWHNVDAEFNDYAIDMLNSVDTLIFGRRTYEMMANYWPASEAIKDDPIVAGKMNSLQKIVFSRSLKNAAWQNTIVVNGDAIEEIKKLKQQEGKDMIIPGSSDLSLTFMEHNLIDEYRIMIAPIVLGNGKPVFKGLPARHKLKLLKAKTYNSGNVLLYYQ